MSDRGFFRDLPPAGTVRPLGVAVLWSYAVALTGGVIVLVAAAISAVVAGIGWLADRSTDVGSVFVSTAGVTAWVFAPIGLAVAVWVAAYGSTQHGSVPRTLIAAPAALAVAVAFLFLDSTGLLGASLAIGWALALPAPAPSWVVVRGMPLLVLALFLPGFGDLPVWLSVVVLLVSPVAAALVVWLADLPRNAGRSDRLVA